mmetsp:Transcript_10757/g.22751  ORF Transcript_10757/g.22751 Transcript_10757/m.22751 type:complete len:296 (-) Transcript_10757:2469-3356(-)
MVSERSGRNQDHQGSQFWWQAREDRLEAAARVPTKGGTSVADKHNHEAERCRLARNAQIRGHHGGSEPNPTPVLAAERVAFQRIGSFRLFGGPGDRPRSRQGNIRRAGQIDHGLQILHGHEKPRRHLRPVAFYPGKGNRRQGSERHNEEQTISEVLHAQLHVLYHFQRPSAIDNERKQHQQHEVSTPEQIYTVVLSVRTRRLATPEERLFVGTSQSETGSHRKGPPAERSRPVGEQFCGIIERWAAESSMHRLHSIVLCVHNKKSRGVVVLVAATTPYQQCRARNKRGPRKSDGR